MSRSFYWLPVDVEPEGKVVSYGVARTVFDYMVERSGGGNADEVTLINKDLRLHGFLDALAVQMRGTPEHVEQIKDLRANLEAYGEIRLFFRY